MSSLELGLAAWLTFNLTLGVDLQASLLPPATTHEIEKVEQAIGYELPQDLQQLYLQANGQLDPFHTPFNGRYAPMFGRYRFLSLSQALTAYNLLHSQYQADRQWQASSNGGAPVTWDVRVGDKVDSAGWNPHWFVFASDQSGFYSVDMAPPEGGHQGQVVLHGPDRWELRVIADSVSQLFIDASASLDPAEPHRYEQSQVMGEGPETAWSYLQFTMDWREQPVVPESEDLQHDAALDAWYEARELKIDHFMHWVDSSAWSANEKAQVEEWVYVNFSLGPSGLFTDPLPGTLVPPYTFQDYLVWLEMNLVQPTGQMIDSLPVSHVEAYELIHQYQFETERWSSQQVDQAQSLVRRFAR